jgi:hypothetical protein
MAIVEIPYKETYKAIVERFPKSRATSHIKSNKNHDVEIVKIELAKIINGHDIESGYKTDQDKKDAKKFLDLLQHPFKST